MPDYQIAGRTAIVTGAAGGLGGAIAERLLIEGANVIAADIEDTDEIVSRLAIHSAERATGKHVDTNNTESVRELMGSSVERFGKVDILINAAAIVGVYAPVADLDDSDMDDLLGNNLRGTIIACREASRLMREQRSGHIVNIASQNGKAAWPNLAVYAATKAGVIALTQGLALEMVPYGVRVNAIAPGTMNAPQMVRAFRQIAAQLGRDADEMIREKTESMPFGRLGEGSDIGSMVAWLVSPEASWTVGATMNLTGGENVTF